MLLIFVYILTALVTGVIFLKHLRAAGIAVSTTFHVYYILYYFVIPPIALLLIDYTNILSKYVRRFILISEADMSTRWFSLLLAVMGYILFLLLFYKRIFTNKVNTCTPATVTPPPKEFYLSLYTVGRIFSLLGIFCMTVVIVELGGISNMLSVAAQLRGYNVGKDGVFSGVGAICLTLAPFIFGGTICIFSCLKKRKYAIIWFLIDLMFLCLYLLFDQGRGPIIFFAVCMLYAYLKNKKIKESRIIGIFLVLAIILVFTSGSLRSALRSISGGAVEQVSFSDNIDSIVNDLTYPYGNTLYIKDIVSESGFRYFKDYYLWIVELLPSQLFSSFGVNIESVNTMTDITSYFWSGGSAHLGGVPIDFISSGYFQAGILGVVLNSCIVLLLLKWIDSIIESLPYRCSAIRFWCCCTITTSTILSMDFCKLPLANLYMFVLIYILRKKTLSSGLYTPSVKFKWGTWSIKFKRKALANDGSKTKS